MTSPETPGTGTPDRGQARALAGTRRERLRRSTRRIRRGVATMAVTLFLLAFMGIYVQMATGHDPALTAKRSSTAAESSLSANAKSTSKAKASSSESSTSSSSEEATSSSSGEEASTGSGAEASDGSNESSTSKEESTKSSSSSQTSEPSSVTTSQS